MTKTLTLGGGCFWCTESVFQRLKGVIKVTSGYAGGDNPNPTYEAVCSGTTGHAEVIKIEYDESIITLENLLEVFFATHDPTTLNRQGADAGTQYRSVVFYADEDERKIAEDFIAKLQDSPEFAGRKIVTKLEPMTKFYYAELYHQDYFNKNPENMYCQLVINPKLKKLEEKFGERLG